MRPVKTKFAGPVLITSCPAGVAAGTAPNTEIEIDSRIPEIEAERPVRCELIKFHQSYLSVATS
jgi:hypothetical protein